MGDPAWVEGTTPLAVSLPTESMAIVAWPEGDGTGNELWIAGGRHTDPTTSSFDNNIGKGCKYSWGVERGE